MKTSLIRRLLLVSAAILCLTVAASVFLTACQAPMTEPTITTAPEPDPGFSLREGDGIRVVADTNKRSFTLYVDPDVTSVDLMPLAIAKKGFTVTDSKDALCVDNVITVTKSGDSFTVYYGEDKEIYRLTVVYNEYVTVIFEGLEKPLSVLKGGKATAPGEMPKKVGFAFDGWDFDFDQPLTSDTTVSAKWKPATYTITFDTKGGELPSTTMTVVYGENVTLPVPTKTGFVFTGWHDGTKIVNSGVWSVDSDITLTAMWDNHDYRITYDPNGGEVDRTLQGVSYGSPFTPPTPKRAGFTFLGWFCGEEPVNVTSYQYREDKTFVAKWQENVYNVTFESNGGSSVEGGEYLYSQMMEIVPIRDGYTFGGWFFDTDLTATDADISNSNAVTAYAWWVEEDKSCHYRYEITDNGVIILGYHSDSDTCILPSYIGGKAVVAIGDNAFARKTSLVSVIFPSSVKTIGDSAFSGCTSLLKINPIETEGDSRPISLDGITSIGKYAFSGCSFSEITLPTTVTVLSEGIFKECLNLREFVSSSIKTVGASAFSGAVSLKTVSFSSSLTSIGKDAFRGCLSLTDVTLPTTITSIESGAFASCTALITLTLPQNLTTIPDELFRGCSSLKTVNQYLTSTKIMSIGAYAFSGCENLATVGIPSSVKSIGAYAFENCLKLEKVTLSAALTEICDGTFKGCTALTSVTVSSLTKIGREAFASCRRLSSLSLNDSLTSIGEDAFKDCMALGSIYLSKKLSYLGEGAFKGCSKLSSVTLPTSITVIASGTFDGCLALSQVIWHNGITEIGARAFAECQALSFDSFPSSCTVIGKEAFVGCRVIQTLSIGANLLKIDSRAFADCISLSKITFAGTNERWKGAVLEDAFEGCDDLMTVETVTFTFDDLRPWIYSNSTTNALWAMDRSLSFNEERPAAVILFKPNNVFYRNLVVKDENGAKINGEYVWILKIEGATEMISSFSTTVTVSLFDVYDVDGYGYVRLDLGEAIASFKDLKHLTLNLEIYAKNDTSKLLYSAALGKVAFTEDKNTLTPDSDRVDQNSVTVTPSDKKAEALFDGAITTGTFSHGLNTVVFDAKDAFVLSSYSFITTASAPTYPTALPKGWTVYGGIVLKDGTVEWVEIDRVDNGWLTSDALTEFHFKAPSDKAYSRYKIEFDESGVIALSEIVMYKK